MKIILAFTKFLSVVLLLSGLMACGSSDTIIEVVIPEGESSEPQVLVSDPGTLGAVASTPEPSPAPSPSSSEEAEEAPADRYPIPDCPEGPMLPAYNCKTVSKKASVVPTLPNYTVYEPKCDFMGRDFKDDPDAEGEDCFSFASQ